MRRAREEQGKQHRQRPRGGGPTGQQGNSPVWGRGGTDRVGDEEANGRQKPPASGWVWDTLLGVSV